MTGSGTSVSLVVDGGTFQCLAATRVVWDSSAVAAALSPSAAGDAACDNTGRANWTYSPPAAGGNTGPNVILRDSSGLHAWLINSAGEIQTIPDGGTYQCLAAANPVIWDTPEDKITEWRPVGNTPATCG